MPPFEQVEKQKLTKLNILAYGPAKMKKTWWATRSVESNFNVLVLNSDVGIDIVKNLKPEHRERLQIIDLISNPESPPAPKFFALFLRGKKFCWDEQGCCEIKARRQVKPDHSYYYIDPSKFTLNDIVVNDSWTSLAKQIYNQAAIEKSVDLSVMGDDDNLKRAIFGYSNTFANWILENQKALNCHWITIGHEDHYEKTDGDKKNPKIILSRIQPKSTSGPHGMQIAANFSDILLFSRVGKAEVDINVGSIAGTTSGSRNLAPKSYKFDELTIQLLCKEASANIPNSLVPFEAIKWYAPGEMVQELPESTVNPEPLIQPATGSVATVGSGEKKISGLAGLLAAKKKG